MSNFDPNRYSLERRRRDDRDTYVTGFHRLLFWPLFALAYLLCVGLLGGLLSALALLIPQPARGFVWLGLVFVWFVYAHWPWPRRSNSKSSS